MSDHTAENGPPGYHCCACCEGVAKDDHVEHGGTVEKDGHDLPCLSCGDEARIRERLARAWDAGARRGYALYDETFAVIERDNPYRVIPPASGDS